MASEILAAIARAASPSLAQAQHDERVAEARESQADAALVHGLFVLRLERPGRPSSTLSSIAHRYLDDVAEALEVETRPVRRRVSSRKRTRLIEPRQQQPYGGSGCSAHGLVASIASQ